MTTDHHEAYKVMLMQAVDGLLPAGDEAAWEAHLASCDECRTEIEEFKMTSDHMDAFRQRMLYERTQRPQTSPMSPGGVLTVVAIVLGLLLMWGFSAWHTITAPGVPIAIRVGHALVLGGLTVGLLVVARDRIRSLKSDPYTEIER